MSLLVSSSVEARPVESGRVDAVIISGSRRGEIISLVEESLDALPSEQEAELISTFCREVETLANNVVELRQTVDSLDAKMQQTVEELRHGSR